MNGTSRPAFAVADLTGWKGYFRLDWKAQPYGVREHRDGKVLSFKTQADAEVAAWRVREKISQSVMRRDGVTLSDNQKAAAEKALFKPKEASCVSQS